MMLLLQDDSAQQAQQALGTAMAGMAGIFIIAGIFILAFSLFFVFLLWRIFTKAGMSGALGLLALPIVPFGPLIAMCILAFGTWKVVPAPQPQQAYGGPPMPPNFPPQNQPPGGYPPQQNLPPGNYPPRY